MKIKAEVLDKVNNPQSRTRIAFDLRIGEQSVYTQMRRNENNGRLTKMDALMAIAKESGIEVSEILESEPASVE